MPGLDQGILNQLDQSLAIGRILTDVNSDFIIAPHFSAVYANVEQELWDGLISDLRSGNYEPELPITIEVPKPSGLTRPGSILFPRDRLIYQAIVDFCAPLVENALDRNRVFSNVLLDPDPNFEMFEAAHISWNSFLNSITSNCQDNQFSHCIKADVASFFERLYQHNIVNLLRSAGCPGGAINLLEELLASFMERDSYGIIQGMFPSDFLGNFYLFSLDSDLDVRKTPSSRYVDDIYIFHDSMSSARKGLLDLCRMLRHEGLHLNERKSGIHETHEILHEETIIDRMFDAARQEVEAQIFNVGSYGFQSMWVPEEFEETENLELQSVAALYSHVDEVDEAVATKIERFCLPYLATAGLDIAVPRSLAGILERPYMSKIYNSYLSTLGIDYPEIFEDIENLIEDERIAYDWQLLWVLADLMRADNVSTRAINAVMRILRDSSRSVALRGLCAILIGMHGHAGQRRNLKHHYAEEPSGYVRTSILFSTRYFPTAERRSCNNAWSGHSTNHTLISEAVRTLV